ncbi:probable ubiquitin carboxyl-terminal hydrolase FAF-X isoform X2 [Stegodyphus dumicola]|uniref:probable ubiquitin carboxyl-terminal hydrolase FAF-X isoform X2 n=1 Tax=Stegodyphus dumicola TaxID=202533 RepID=UPI0015B12748|nr:probable ubiquitin carboxyl-terminal hydrolase FAF-X isoform X2 [Stegodyphus dumicola]
MTIVMRGGQIGGGDSPQENIPLQPPRNNPVPSPNVLNESEGKDQDESGELPEGHEPDFPLADLARLDEMINRPRWVVPVLPKGELEVLLDAAINLSKLGIDNRSEACQRFYRDGLTISFTKILTDEAVSGWKFEIHRCIMKNCENLVELCVLRLNQDCLPLLDLLAMVLNPNSKFHTFNGTRPSETVPTGSQIPDEEIFARPSDLRTPKGWLVDLINRFGSSGGFHLLLERFQNGPLLTVPVIAALIRPFGMCHDLLTVHTVEKYFMPIVEIVPSFLDNLTDDELKKEAKNETKNDALSGIVKALKCLSAKVPNQETTVKSLETFRLKMILRLLQISSFNGKMNALNEVNKVIASVSYYTHRHANPEEEDWLTAERVAEWIKENKVLQIVLRDSLHQPQYVEKLEKILRFVIKEKSLTLEDLDDIWAAQSGKHEAIVKNVHDLLAKLAWDFTPEQLDHLFECFQASWTNASKKQREKLLELIRRLAEDDKDGVMAHKVLNLLWSLAHSNDVPTDIMDQALTAHVKILDYSCSQDRDSQKTHWLDRCVEELKNDKWVLPALKQIREICNLYSEAPPNFNHAQRSPHMFYRHEVINRLQQHHSLVILVADNLTAYMNRAHVMAKEHPELDPNSVSPDSRYSHVQQVQERLNFLRFLLKDGQLWLCAPQAKQIWTCLAENAVYVTDREACFKWFSKLMGEEPDLDPEINRDFFENIVLQLDPCLLTESGIKCFDRFFKAVNSKESKLIAKRRAFLMNDLELLGLDYLWRVVLCSSEDVANRAIELLKETYTNLGPQLQANQMDIHEDFVQSCMDRLKAAFDTISVLERDKDGVNRLRQETVRMVRILKVLREYVGQCDGDYGEERSILPMARAHRGKQLSLTIRFSNQGRNFDDTEVWTHLNDTLGAVRRQILTRVKANNVNMKVDLFVNGELLDPADDKKLVSQLPLRDKMIISAKLCQIGTNVPSSPDSSSDSSTGSPQHPYDGPNVEAENCLPGVLMSQQQQYAQFLFQLADLGSSLNVPALRDEAYAVLKLMPPDAHTYERLKTICLENSKLGDRSPSPSLESIFFAPSPSQVLYTLEVVYTLLMPAHNPMSEEAQNFQYNFVRSGGVPVTLGMITKNNFLSGADVSIKRSAYLVVLKILKLLLTTVGRCIVLVEAEVMHSRGSPGSLSPSSPSSVMLTGRASVLQQALTHIPNPNSEFMLRNVSVRLAQLLHDQAISHRPDLATVKAIMKMAWASSSGSMDLMQASYEELHQLEEKICKPVDSEEIQLCREALEVLTISLALCPEALDTLMKEKAWHVFIIDLLLICKNRSIRICAADQFLLIATKCYFGHQCLVFSITLLFTQLMTTVKEYAKNSHEFFTLLCRLLNYACGCNCPLPTAQNLLNNEIDWLKSVRNKVLSTGDSQVDEALLEGHLGVTRELVSFLGPDRKYEVGADPGVQRGNLIKELVEDFIFPASRVVLQVQRSGGELPSEQAIPVCSSSSSVVAAFDLLVGLCTGCAQNLRLLVEMLCEMFYSANDHPLTEWEYLPPVGPRPPRGFVGLKNAGATCYMNSVLQQLYMIEDIRNGILSVEGAATDLNEDFSGEERIENEQQGIIESDIEGCEEKGSREETRKEYNLGVLKQVQAIFGHLACSKLQYYVPRGFWKHFKLWGEPVNLREQHDALEFFNSLVDSLEEALKLLNQPCILSQILSGSFADQKICKDCPHRYSREESFTALNIDIRNHSNLLDSLEQYVKGDLLEGANAYHCEKCNKKVDTVKRLCIKKLPPILAIQLKRFDYDWERECAIKFNDYFEFPREFDMEPYTVKGLAKIEGEMIEDDFNVDNESCCTKYKLTGIVVHSGQASGGHYYSYILHRHSDGNQKWYKFDDGEVMECKMEDDEEIKNQCFGGDYMGEVFDHMLKRMSYRRQKRWWNAYILFYRRVDMETNITRSLNELTLSDNKQCVVKMPAAIERSVRRQNIKFMHNRNQFSLEYFQFMKKLILCNGPYVTIPGGHDKLTADGEELALISIQLAAKFLFTTGFHAKKTLRGPANDWYDALCIHLRNSCNVRRWFANNVLFSNPHIFCEYLLECPGSEVRSAFMRILVFIAHFALQDGPYTPPAFANSPYPVDSSATLADHLIMAVLNLLKKEVSEHGRHLTQYFSLFAMFASLGVAERTMLLQLNVPATFMKVALDEGPGPPIKYQYAELGKLYQVVSLLIRSCDVSCKTQSSHGGATLPNPFVGDNIYQEYLMPIQPEVADILYNNTCYLKKIVEDANNSEDTLRLLKFCSWENPHFSSMVLNELLWQVSYSYTYELRPYLDLLLHMMLLEDSWQNHRIHNALKGIPDDRDGLFDTIQRSKNHHQKRAYQCIKCMVTLFVTCPAAAQMLQSNGDLKRKWSSAVEWLNDELERRPYAANAQYGYNNWSPPAQSNETSNGYFLERSHTARITLAKAFEICPDEDIEDQDMSEDGESPPPEDKVQTWQGNGPSIPQHPSPPPPAPSDSTGPIPKTPTQRLPVLSSSELIVEEPVEPSFMSSNNGSSSDTQHTSDSTSSSITTTVSPTNVTLSEEGVQSQLRKQQIPAAPDRLTEKVVKPCDHNDETTLSCEKDDTEFVKTAVEFVSSMEPDKRRFVKSHSVSRRKNPQNYYLSKKDF